LSQIICAFSYGWAVLAGDRGMWEWGEHGEPINVRQHAEPKIRVTPGYPCAIAAVGPAYADGVIADYIATHEFNLRHGAFATANELWPSLCDIHAPRNGALDLQRACMSMLVACVDPHGWPRVYAGEFPTKELDALHIFKRDGEMTGAFACGVFAMGSFNGMWGVPFVKMDAPRGVEVVRETLAFVDRVEALRKEAGESVVITPPYDILLLTKSGAEWIERAEIAEVA
jgi:hypothetical protein